MIKDKEGDRKVIKAGKKHIFSLPGGNKWSLFFLPLILEPKFL